MWGRSGREEEQECTCPRAASISVKFAASSTAATMAATLEGEEE